MPTPRQSVARRALAVVAALGVAASLTAAPVVAGSAAALAADPSARVVDEAGAADVLVRPAPRDTGRFVVRGGTSSRSAAGGGLTPAAERDLRRYARASGEDLDALLVSHRGVDELADYAADLEARRPGLFTAVGLGADGEGGWIQVTRRPGPAEVARIRRLPVDVEVAYGAPASSTELARLSEQLIDAVGAAPEGIDSAQAAYDEGTRRMVLSVNPVDGTSRTAFERLAETAVRAVVPATRGALPLEVVTREVAFDVDRETTVQGGATLTVQGRPTCTAGFTALRRGHRGLLTARHCPDRMTYGRQPGVLGPRAGQTTDPRIDLQFHRTVAAGGRRTGVQFRASEDSRRTVQRVANAPRGSVVCHWGFASRFSCARVRATDQCVWVDRQKTCGLDSTRRYVSAAGDSGGPWFLGNTARGIHTGGGGGSSVFTRIGRVRALDARLLTDGDVEDARRFGLGRVGEDRPTGPGRGSTRT